MGSCLIDKGSRHTVSVCISGFGTENSDVNLSNIKQHIGQKLVMINFMFSIIHVSFMYLIYFTGPLLYCT